MAESKVMKKGGKGGNTVKLVRELVQPIADEVGVSVWDVIFEKEGASWYLKVLIDRFDGGLTMDDCEAVTRPLSKKLDEVDPIEVPYMLEVGSPGLGRALKKPEHFAEFIDCPVRVRYIRETDGVKEFLAVLKSYNEDGSITVGTEDGEKTVALSDTASVKLCDDEDLFDDLEDNE